MVARIKTGPVLNKAMNYNENKVQQGTAELLHAANFLKPADQMNFYEKKERFERNNELNERSKSNTLHATVAFDPSEKLSNEQMKQIADRYMEGLGMKDHPYLVYRHHDTDVPHIHIVATLIDDNGARLNTNNIGKDRSEPTRKAIEQEFGLVRAENQKQDLAFQVKPVDVQKVVHGEKPTKQAIQNVVTHVTQEYNYTSLSELNAILRLYNVKADQGEKNSRANKHDGLYYKVLDDTGNTVGIPIKASTLPYKPTKKALDQQYGKNKKGRDQKVADLKARVDYALQQSPESLQQLTANLQKESIDVISWKNEQGKIYGLTYVDHKNKIAVKGSDLGKAYSAAGMERTYAPSQQQAQGESQESTYQNKQQQGRRSPDPQTVAPRQQTVRDSQRTPSQSARKEDSQPQPLPPVNTSQSAPSILHDHHTQFNSKSPQLLSSLLNPVQGGDDMPAALKQDQKKKKKRQQH